MALKGGKPEDQLSFSGELPTRQVLLQSSDVAYGMGGRNIKTACNGRFMQFVIIFVRVYILAVFINTPWFMNKPSTRTYIMPSYRTSPNRTKIDNWSTKVNYNPYTEKYGTKKSY